MATKLKNVSILTAGEAKGHNLLIDETSLQQALAVAQAMGRIKVTNGHGAQQVMDILGYVENFRIEGGRLLGDLTLLNSDKADYVANLANLMPDQFGLSLTFSGVPEACAGQSFARVTEIYDVSVVTQPAANPAGMFSSFSALSVDTFQKAMIETKAEKVELNAAAPVAEPEPEPAPAPAVAPVALAEAPAAPAPAVKTKAAEPTLADVAAMLTEVLAYLKKDEAEDDASDSSEMPAPAVVEAAAKTETTTLSRVEKDAAGAAPVPAKHADSRLSRTEILKQFNEEKDPLKRTTLLRKLGL
ncbi:hypothetical protein EBS57_07725 [bacterium]|nr:hypothetical protein [bacterium]